MPIIEQNITTINLLNEYGLGVSNNGKIKVPFVLPLERIKYTKHCYRNKVNFTLDEVLDFSPQRTTAPCKYFTICGGCKLQHANQELYKTYKTSLITKEISNLSKNTIINDLIIAPQQSRRRLQLSFIKKEEKVFMGFQKLNSHKIVDIDSCYIADADLAKLFIPLKELILLTLTTSSSGSLYLLKADNGITIEIDVNKGCFLESNYEKLLQDFSEKHQIIEIKINFTGNNDQYLYAKTPATINFSGISVNVSAKCFLQASKFSDDFLAKEVIKYISQIYPNKEKNELKIADLFCGRGTFTIALAQQGTVVYGYESDAAAIRALGDAIRLNNLNIKITERDLFAFPLFSNDLNNFDIIVMNPPRAGASTQVKELCKSKVRYLIYVSCNPKTFTSDTKELLKNGYALQYVTPFDQFLYSNHLEVVGLFVKK